MARLAKSQGIDGAAPIRRKGTLMQITLPHAREKVIKLRDLVAAWIHYSQSSFRRTDWREFIMPINHAKEGTPKHPGFDTLCRVLAGGGCVSTMQATDRFFAQNSQCVEKLPKAARNASTDRAVHGARLTAASMREWDSMPDSARRKCLDRAERMLLADQEDENRHEVVCGDAGDVTPHSTDLRVSAVAPRSEVNSLRALAQSLVDVIDRTPFQAHYWENPAGLSWVRPKDGNTGTTRTFGPTRIARASITTGRSRILYLDSARLWKKSCRRWRWNPS
jgi:hypothetical protein